MNYTEFGSANFAVLYADFVGWVEKQKRKMLLSIQNTEKLREQ